MDKSILIEYADMKEEIKDLRRRIAEDQKRIDQLQRMIVSDSVSCGKKGKKPIRTVKIKGFPKVEIERRIKTMKKRKAKLRMLEERKRRGKESNWKTAEEVFLWWMEDDNIPGQMSIEDFQEMFPNEENYGKVDK